MTFHLVLLPQYVAKPKPAPKPVFTGQQIVAIIRNRPPR